MGKNSSSFVFVLLCMILSIAFSAMVTPRILTENRILQEQPITEEQILARIDEKIQQKRNASSDRDRLIFELNNLIEETRNISLNIIDSKYAAEVSYRNYYNERQKCDGLKAELSIVGTRAEVSEDECLEFPIATEAVQLYVQKSQLEGFQVDEIYAKKAHDIQAQWVTDAEALNNIYRDLQTFFTGKDSTLQQHFSIKAFNTQNFVHQERQKRDQNKLIWDGAANNVNGTAAQIRSSENALASRRSACDANLPGLKADLDEKLASAASLQSDLNAKSSEINQKFEEIDAKMRELEGITVEMNQLADQYAAIAQEI